MRERLFFVCKIRAESVVAIFVNGLQNVFNFAIIKKVKLNLKERGMTIHHDKLAYGKLARTSEELSEEQIKKMLASLTEEESETETDEDKEKDK